MVVLKRPSGGHNNKVSGAAAHSANAQKVSAVSNYFTQSRFTGYFVLFFLFALVLCASLALNLRPEIAEITTFVTLFGYLALRRRFKRSRSVLNLELAASC